MYMHVVNGIVHMNELINDLYFLYVSTSFVYCLCVSICVLEVVEDHYFAKTWLST